MDGTKRRKFHRNKGTQSYAQNVLHAFPVNKHQVARGQSSAGHVPNFLRVHCHGCKNSYTCLEFLLALRLWWQMIHKQSICTVIASKKGEHGALGSPDRALYKGSLSLRVPASLRLSPPSPSCFLVGLSSSWELLVAAMGAEAEAEAPPTEYFIIRPKKIRLIDILSLLVLRKSLTSYKFVESSGTAKDGLRADWVTALSLLIMKVLDKIKVPLKWTGIIVEFIFNLFALNGGIRIIWRIITGSLLSATLFLSHRDHTRRRN